MEVWKFCAHRTQQPGTQGDLSFPWLQGMIGVGTKRHIMHHQLNSGRLWPIVAPSDVFFGKGDHGRQSQDFFIRALQTELTSFHFLSTLEDRIKQRMNQEQGRY